MGMAESDGDSVPYSDRLAIVISGNKIGQRFDYTDCFFVQKLVNTANNLYFTNAPISLDHKLSHNYPFGTCFWEINVGHDVFHQLCLSIRVTRHLFHTAVNLCLLLSRHNAGNQYGKHEYGNESFHFDKN